MLIFEHITSTQPLTLLVTRSLTARFGVDKRYIDLSKILFYFHRPLRQQFERHQFRRHLLHSHLKVRYQAEILKKMRSHKLNSTREIDFRHSQHPIFSLDDFSVEKSDQWSDSK